jgi:hypothetical protein
VGTWSHVTITVVQRCAYPTPTQALHEPPSVEIDHVIGVCCEPRWAADWVCSHLWGALGASSEHAVHSKCLA